MPDQYPADFFSRDIPAPSAAPQQADTAPQQYPSDFFSRDLHEGAQGGEGRPLAETALMPVIGANRALKETLAIPGNLTGWALSKATGDESYRGAGSRAVGTLMMGADPDKGEWKKPRNEIEKGLQAAGEGAASAILPEAAVSGMARAGAASLFPRAMDALSAAFGTGTKASLASNAAIGAGAGVGSEIGDTVGGMPGAIIGGLAGGIGAAGAAGAGKMGWAGAKAAAGKAKEFVEPIRNPEMAAARRLEAATGTNARAAIEAIDQGDKGPVSKMTTFQQSGLMPLGAAEKELGALYPDRFAAHQAEQNAARDAALTGVVQGGAAEDVPKALQAAMHAIDAGAEQTVQQALEGAQRAAARLPAERQAEGVGAALRGHLADALAATKDSVQKLWDRVDPGRKLTVDFAPFQREVASVYSDLPVASRSMVDPVETQIQQMVSAISDTFGQTVPLREITALRSEITGAMMAENASNMGVATPAYRRLVELRGAMDRAMNDSIRGRIAEDASAVAAGRMPAEGTLEARLRNEVSAWMAERGQSAGERPARAVSGGPGPVRPASGPQGQGGGEPRVRPGNPGMAGETGPTFDAAARQRLNEATEATRQQHETFDRGPVGRVLATGKTKSDYRLTDAAVPEALWRRGDQGFATAQAYLQASGGGAEARAALHDAAASSLRRFAEAADGTIDPKKLQQWRQRHASALRAVPELSREFSSAGRAAEALASARAGQVAALRDFERGVVGQVLRADPADVPRVVGGIFGKRSSVSDMKALRAALEGQPGGVEGLHRAIAEHIIGLAKGTAEAGTTGVAQIKSATFQKFMNRNTPALRAAGFSDEQIKTLNAIGADLQQANRSVASVRVGGGSDTAQKTIGALRAEREAIARGTEHTPLMEMWALGATGMHLAGTLGALAGAAVGPARHALNSARTAGLQNVHDLLVEAMINPAVARRLLEKLPAKMPKPAEDAYRARLGRALVRSASYSSSLALH